MNGQNIINNDREWSRDDEKNLIGAISSGTSIEEFSVRSGRNLRSSQQRLKKIIYTNVMNGKTISVISSSFHMPEDVVRNMFYDYKKLNDSFGSIGQNVQPMQPMLSTVPLQQPRQSSLPYEDQNIVQHGGKSSSGKDALTKRMDKRLKKLDDENHMLKIIIENKELHRKLDRLIKDGIVDPGVKLLLKEIKHTK